MPVTLVQEADAASSSLTLSATTAGNTVVVAVACLGATSATGVTGITLGTNPDNFTLVSPGPSAHDTTSPNDYLNVSVWADPNCAGSATALSVTGTGVLAVWAWEFSGLSGTVDVAQVLQVSTYQDSWMATASQTTVPAEAWVAVVAAANQTASETITETGKNGWALQNAYNGTSGPYDWGAVAAYQTVNTLGTPSLAGTFSQPSMSSAAIVTFGMALPAAPAAPVAPGTPLAVPAPPSTTASGTAGGTGNLAVHGNLTVSGTTKSAGAVYQGGAPVGLTPTGIKTGNYTAQPGDFVIVQSAANRSVTITFPAGAATGSLAGVKLINGTGFPVIVQAAGTDVFDVLPAGTTGIEMYTTGATFIAQYQAANTTWYIQSASYTEPATIPSLPATGVLPGAPAANSALPHDLGFVTWSYDPAYLNSPLAGTALSSGTIYLVMCQVRATAVLSNAFAAWITSAGSGLTAGQNFVGVYSAVGTRLGVSADVTGAFGAGGAFSAGFTQNVTVVPPYVWAAFLSNGTVPPSFARTVSQAGVLANGNLSAVNARFGTVSGTFTSLPSSVNTALINTAATAYWVGLD